MHRDTRRWRKLFTTALVAAGLAGSALPAATAAWAGGGGCALIPKPQDPSRKVLQCGAELTVQAAPGARFHPIYSKGQSLPAGLKLDGGALLIEFHPSDTVKDFQILTPLAIAAVRGTKWAMDVAPKQTSALVLAGAVAVTNRRLNQYVVLTEGQGVDIAAADTTMTQKTWGQTRVRALLSRFGE